MFVRPLITTTRGYHPPPFRPAPLPRAQFVGRWAVDVADSTTVHAAFDDSDMPVTNPDLDPLLQVCARGVVFVLINIKH